MNINNEKPVDRVAARVVFARGEHFEPDKPKDQCADIWLSPPEYEPGVLSGVRHGRITYLGLPVSKKLRGRLRRGKGGGKWIVRCDCGNFTTKRAAARSHADFWSTMCSDCAIAADLSRRFAYKKARREAEA